MTEDNRPAALAAVLAQACRSGTAAVVPPDLLPTDEDTADRVQALLADLLGPIAGYKVAQSGDAPGSFGAILACDLHNGSEPVRSVRDGLKVEVEIAFRLASDLAGRRDGAAYSRTDIERALAGALLAVEIVGGRLPTDQKPSPLLARADRLSNFGLVVAPLVADWQPFARPTGYDARLVVGGQSLVEGQRRHPSGRDPLHPLVWLANRLVQLGGGLKAGDVVTTGAFGGAHPIRLGAWIEATVGGLGTLAFAIDPASSPLVVA